MHNQEQKNPLRMVFWESTARCNLSCAHCRRLDTKQQNELSTIQAKSMIDQLGKMGQVVLVLSGGEPLLRNDWAELGSYAKHKNVTAALATNGTLIDADIAGQIAQCGLKRVSISLDSPNAAIHDKFRAQQGSYTAALNGIQHLRANNIAFQINMSVTRNNIGQLDAMHELCDEIGAVGLHFFMLVPVGCGRENAPKFDLTAKEYEDVLNWICDKSIQSQLDIRATCSPHYYRVAAQRGIKPKHSRGCLAGISVMFISHTGEVFPCGYFPIPCGDITKQTMNEIWNDSKVFNELRDYDNLKGKCGSCGFKKICGGCRARALAQTGDYLSTEPNCTYLN